MHNADHEILHPRRRGRPATHAGAEQLRIPLAAGTTVRIDAAVREGETRLDLIRAAIEREIRRRYAKS